MIRNQLTPKQKQKNPSFKEASRLKGFSAENENKYMDRRRENLTRGVNTGCIREESWLGFPSCLSVCKKEKKIQGKMADKNISERDFR